MRIIAIEEHFHGPYYLDYLEARKEYPRLERVHDSEGREIWRWWNNAGEYRQWLPRAIARMRDIDEGRLRDMDEDGIDMQVLSLPPGIDAFNADEGTAITRKVNENLADAIKKHPERFAGFAALALKDPYAAAAELERSVKELGLKGAMVFPHIQGEYIDDKKYWPVFQKAAQLDVPLYIHPIHFSRKSQHMCAGYPEMAGSLWGFAIEAGTGAIRLICSGLFDELPNLKIILGHLGEALPFWMWRLDERMQHSSVTLMRTDEQGNAIPAFTPLSRSLKKLPSQCLRENFYFTLSGMLFTPALLCTILALGADRVLFAVDYPMEPNKEAKQFTETSPISESDKEKIFHLNAEKLLLL